ncbi:MAG: ArsR/SmtB family transcription factor [Propionibacteriaceae bacterium]
MTPKDDLARRRAELTGVPEQPVRLTDARAIRAIAHEARQQVIHLLFSEGKPYTSTELAAVTGLTPSAMSYHLRALERYGVVERDDGAGDARQRPWRAAGTSLEISGRGPGGEGAADALHAQAFQAMARRVQRLRAMPEEERTGYVALSSGDLWLDPDQTVFVSEALDRALIELLDQGWRNQPEPGRRRMGYLWSALPDSDEVSVDGDSQTPTP